jgi:hypothetical protein
MIMANNMGFKILRIGLYYAIMKVPEIRKPAIKAANKVTQSEKAGGTRFAEHLNQVPPAPGGAPAVVETAPVAPVSSILSIQEVDAETPKDARRRMVHYGADILDRLDEIRDQILTGAVSKNRLENLAVALRQRRESVDDPQLVALIDEIELRAEVELAKLTRTI